jgi:hypothetical protein
MAEGAWFGEIVSPGVWVESKEKIPSIVRLEGNEFFTTPDGQEENPIAMVAWDLIDEKIRLVSSVIGKHLYDDEVWETYTETPFGEFNKIRWSVRHTYESYLDGKNCFKMSNTSGISLDWEYEFRQEQKDGTFLVVVKDGRQALQKGIKDFVIAEAPRELIHLYDNRVAGELCYRTGTSKKKFHACWDVVFFCPGADMPPHDFISRTHHTKDNIVINICPECENKAKKGTLSILEGYIENIHLQEIPLTSPDEPITTEEFWTGK